MRERRKERQGNEGGKVGERGGGGRERERKGGREREGEVGKERERERERESHQCRILQVSSFSCLHSKACTLLAGGPDLLIRVHIRDTHSKPGEDEQEQAEKKQ